MRRRRRPPDDAVTRAVVEVASVKAQALSAVRRIQMSLHELEETLTQLPGEVENDVRGAGEEKPGADG